MTMMLEHESREGTTTKRPAVLPWVVILFAGAAALGLYFLISPLFGPGAYYRLVLYRTTYGYAWQILLLFIPYGLALWAWWRGGRMSWKLLLAGAVTLHLIVLFAPLAQSQDFYQYLFYGRMQAAFHANPYVIQPQQYWQDAWYIIRWPDQTSVYGPVWSLLSFAVAKAAGSSLTRAVVFMKLVILAMDLGIIWCIARLARDREDPDGATGLGLLLYAWNPLILITVPLGGLADVAVAAGILGAMVAMRRRRTWMATALLAAATLVKIYAGIALLLYLVLVARRRDRRELRNHTLFAAALAAVTFAPYWAGWRTFRGILNVADLSNKSLTGTIQRVLLEVFRFVGVHAARADAAAVIRWTVFPLLLLATVWAVRRTESEHDVWYGTMVVLSLYVLLTPWYLYWYLVAPIALVAALPRNRFTLPVVAFSGTTFLVLRFAPWVLGQVAQTTIRYGPPLALYRWEGRRNRDLGRRGAWHVEPTEPRRLRDQSEAGRFINLV
jgi:Glycosyltransferase family 87